MISKKGKIGNKKLPGHKMNLNLHMLSPLSKPKQIQTNEKKLKQKTKNSISDHAVCCCQIPDNLLYKLPLPHLHPFALNFQVKMPLFLKK